MSEIKRTEEREDGLYEVTYTESSAVKKTTETQVSDYLKTVITDESLVEDIMFYLTDNELLT
jgi:hypothetical protein